MGNLQRQNGTFCRSDSRRQARLLIREGIEDALELEALRWQELLDQEPDEAEDREDGYVFVSLADVTRLWHGTVCLCGHGPELHDSETRMCVDPDCRSCHEGYQTAADDDDLLSRSAGDGYYGYGTYHSNGRPDIRDRYFDMLDG